MLRRVPDHYSCLVGIAHMSKRKNRSSDQAETRVQKALSVFSYKPLSRAKREHLTNRILSAVSPRVKVEKIEVAGIRRALRKESSWTKPRSGLVRPVRLNRTRCTLVYSTNGPTVCSAQPDDRFMGYPLLKISSRNFGTHVVKTASPNYQASSPRPSFENPGHRSSETGFWPAKIRSFRERDPFG